MRKPEPIVEDLDEVGPADYESSAFKMRKNLQRVLGNDVHITFGRHPRFDPTRLSMLLVGSPRYTPVRWSGLTESQKKQMEDFIVYYGTDDLVTWGDTVVMTCPEAEWQAELKRKAQVAAKADGQHIVQQFRQDVSGSGLRVDTKWDDRGGSAPRKE